MLKCFICIIVNIEAFQDDENVLFEDKDTEWLVGQGSGQGLIIEYAFKLLQLFFR